MCNVRIHFEPLFETLLFDGFFVDESVCCVTITNEAVIMTDARLFSEYVERLGSSNGQRIYGRDSMRIQLQFYAFNFGFSPSRDRCSNCRLCTQSPQNDSDTLYDIHCYVYYFSSNIVRQLAGNFLLHENCYGLNGISEENRNQANFYT